MTVNAGAFLVDEFGRRRPGGPGWLIDRKSVNNVTAINPDTETQFQQSLVDLDGDFNKQRRKLKKM